VLELQQTKITDKALSPLPQFICLWRLDLAGTQVTDNALSIVSKIPILESLVLRETKVSPAAIARLRQERPGLRIYADDEASRQLEFLEFQKREKRGREK